VAEATGLSQGTRRAGLQALARADRASGPPAPPARWRRRGGGRQPVSLPEPPLCSMPWVPVARPTRRPWRGTPSPHGRRPARPCPVGPTPASHQANLSARSIPPSRPGSARAARVGARGLRRDSRRRARATPVPARRWARPPPRVPWRRAGAGGARGASRPLPRPNGSSSRRRAVAPTAAGAAGGRGSAHVGRMRRADASRCAPCPRGRGSGTSWRTGCGATIPRLGAGDRWGVGRSSCP
jgi:hypothetical protein